MRWVRANLRVAAWCGLFALAIQLVLSSGHFHFGGVGAAAADGSQLTLAHRLDVAGAPTKPGDPDADYCAICALINLSHSLVPGVTPAIALAAVDSHALTFPRLEAPLTAPASRLASARAPPQA